MAVASAQSWPAPITSQLVDDPACWHGPDMHARREEWTLQLTEAHTREIEAAMANVEEGLDMALVTKDLFPLPTLGPLLAEKVVPALDTGRGFALISGLPVESWSETTMRLALWGIGTHLGIAEKQDAAGNLIHDVKDIAPKANGQTLEQRMAKDSTIRGFQTNAALPFHTDGCDAFALCCKKQGRSGGESLLVSAPAVFNRIAQLRPDLAAVLQQPFHFDARGQRADGSRCQVHPIFTIHEGRLFAVHKEPYIHSAQRFEDVPRLTQAQREALDFLREVMDSEELLMKFTLKPGQVIIASNHSTLHGRAAFDDEVGSEAQSERHMLRLWLSLPDGRALPPHYADTREYCDSFSRRRQPELVVFDGSMGRHLLNNGLPSDPRLWSAVAFTEEKYHTLVVDAHREYIVAGADMITTNNYAVQPTYYQRAFGERWRELLVEHTRLAAALAAEARATAGRPGVKILGCLPPLVDSHRPDATARAYASQGQAFFQDVYDTIARELAPQADVLLAETMSTPQELLCALRAAASVGRPIIVSLAAALRDASLKECPERAELFAEFVLLEVESDRVQVPVLSFNCASPEICTRALQSLGSCTRQRLRKAGIALGVYPNLNAGAEQRQREGWKFSKVLASGEKSAKIPRREDMGSEKIRLCCDEWRALGCTHIGFCCGSTPCDIQSVASYLKPAMMSATAGA